MTKEEAIKKIKTWDFLDNDEKEVLETLIPELRESEDERIRKEIISALKYANHEGVYNKHLAWLEKQGEQKSVDDLTQQEAMDIAVAKCFEKGEQKPKWSEEDDYYRDNLVVWLNCGAVRVDLRKDFIDWLKSLKQRMEEQQ